MKKLLSRMSYGNPKHLIRPSVWNFFEDFSGMFPAIAVFVAIYTVVGSLSEGVPIDFTLLVTVSAVVIALAFAQYAIGCRAYYNRFIPAAKHMADARIDFVKKLRRLPLGFFSRKQSGELINNFATDFVNIQQMMVGFIPMLSSAVFSCVLTAIFLFIFNPAMAAAFYIAIPVAAVILYFSMKAFGKHATRVASARDKAATGLNEYLRGMRVLKSYNQTGEGFTKLKNDYRHLMEACIAEESGSGSLMRLCTSLVQVGLPLMCLTGGYLILGGSLGIVDFICLIIVGTRILSPVVVAVSELSILRAHYISAQRIGDTIDEPEMSGTLGFDLEDTDGKGARPGIELRFDHVDFAYTDDGEQVLHDLSFSVPSGRLTAIVGPSGSGKSTILRLIARFWDVSAGSIVCNGRALSEIDAESWQESISMVMQDVYLFNETIRENILFGRKDADEEEMVAAARRAGCHNFIMELPDDYDSIVGEGGSTLSGGEKQRISIARALLKKAPILLLDEPTASLDAKNEVLVQRAVSEVVQNTTVVMIAHRLKTVKNAAQILVMDKGRLVEQGNHETLLAQGGVYAKLWEMQQQSMEYHIER